MGKFDRFCQSCGMPLEKDEGKGGTNQDGTKSSLYCSLCYRDGAFTGSFTSSREMVKFVKGKLKEMGMGPLKRWFYTSHIPRLERWQKK
ncbi:MAG: zinc ribbon domain-containing protein [Bacteroidetes bacterium]|nr:zinc ribbon domain-containing protein [Bacteroidota bacterium]